MKLYPAIEGAASIERVSPLQRKRKLSSAVTRGVNKIATQSVHHEEMNRIVKNGISIWESTLYQLKILR